MDYRVDIRKDSNNTYLATFPDLPGVHTYGESKTQAIERASDALLTGLMFMIRTRRTIPSPRATAGYRVEVPATVAAKIALHNSMLEHGINRAELSRRLDLHRPQVDRLVDVRHASRIDQLEAAFGALGQRLEISVSKATKSKVA